MIPLNKINKLRRAGSPNIDAHLARLSHRAVRIYSREHHAYWRPGGAGYTTFREASGVYLFADAFERTYHYGPEKEIWYEFLSSEEITFEETFDLAAAAARSALSTVVESEAAAAKVAIRLWHQHMRNWSHDIDYLSRQLLSLRHNGTIGHQAFLHAAYLATNAPVPPSPRGTNGTARVDFIWQPERRNLHIKPNPISGMFILRPLPAPTFFALVGLAEPPSTRPQS